MLSGRDIKDIKVAFYRLHVPLTDILPTSYLPLPFSGATNPGLCQHRLQ